MHFFRTAVKSERSLKNNQTEACNPMLDFLWLSFSFYTSIQGITPKQCIMIRCNSVGNNKERYTSAFQKCRQNMDILPKQSIDGKAKPTFLCWRAEHNNSGEVSLIPACLRRDLFHDKQSNKSLLGKVKR